MNKHWVFKPQPNSEVTGDLATSLSIDHQIAEILVRRGINTFDKAKDFFRPSLKNLHNPFLLKDMDTALDRINKAIDHQEKVMIFGDYDVDGTTSVAMIYQFLSDYIDDLEYYVPDRYTEGYGVSKQSIDYAIENNFNLIITLDCGIKAHDKIALAKDADIDFIVCDHHTPDDHLPKACAILNPKRKDCNYPYDELSGCGVGFKFIQAFCEQRDLPEAHYLRFLDLVCISIASDLVPITGENRILAFHGLQFINQFPSPCLKTLLRTAGADQQVLVIEDIVFKIAPRINAAGRISTARNAVKLLVSKQPSEIEQLSKEINDYNEHRKSLDKTITEQALELIKADSKTKFTTVVASKDWHKGVVGIVASRLIETHYRPTIVLTESNGKLTGSARSIEGFNIYDAIAACKELLTNFGGHKYAAGLTMEKDQLLNFQEKFEKEVAKRMKPEMMIPKVNIETELDFQQINAKFLNIVDQMAPYGPGNMRPIFASRKVYDTGQSKLVGADASHLKLEVTQLETDKYQGIAFSMGHKYSSISTGQPFNICYNIGFNEFRGQKNIQLFVKDIQLNASSSDHR